MAPSIRATLWFAFICSAWPFKLFINRSFVEDTLLTAICQLKKPFGLAMQSFLVWFRLQGWPAAALPLSLLSWEGKVHHSLFESFHLFLSRPCKHPAKQLFLRLYVKNAGIKNKNKKAYIKHKSSFKNRQELPAAAKSRISPATHFSISSSAMRCVAKECENSSLTIAKQKSCCKEHASC